jgi:hypothetical protein
MPSLNKCIGPPSSRTDFFLSCNFYQYDTSINKYQSASQQRVAVRLADRRLDRYTRAFLQRLSANESMQSCGVHYGVNATMRLFHRRSRGGNQDSDDGRRPRAYRSAPLFARQGRGCTIALFQRICCFLFLCCPQTAMKSSHWRRNEPHRIAGSRPLPLRHLSLRHSAGSAWPKHRAVRGPL